MKTNRSKGNRTLVWAALCGCALMAANAFGALTVSPIFRSDMVLQRGMPVPVFGTADPGATVTVQFQNQSKSAVADASGKWIVTLSSMSASASPSMMTVSSGSTSIGFAGVQVGEVWLCSGQSNMGWSLEKADGGSAAIAESGNFNIRLFRMTAGNGPSTTSWQVANPNTTPNFSAVGWWMGRELCQWFGNVPIGLIQATHDGTSITHWTHTNGGEGDDYDAMVKAIQPFAIRGIAWYQGESDAGDSNYEKLLTDMIAEWRSDWGLSTLPFGIVQLTGTVSSSSSGGARLGQLHVSLKVSNTYLVVTSDLPGGNQLHPTVKKPIGLRLGVGARGKVYGENIVYSGPVRAAAPDSYVSGNTIVLNFTHLGNGLITSDGNPPGPFSVASASGSFASANALIVGNSVHVSSSRVSSPTRVKYQFGGTGNLFNSVSIPVEGGASTITMLPASMFLLDLSSGGGGGGCTASTMHVASIVKGTWNAGGGKKGGSVQVTIKDNCGNPVSGATVTGTFSGDFNETRSGTTGSNGVATINTVATKSGTVNYTFCVDNVTGSLTYDPNANVQTCQ